MNTTHVHNLLHKAASTAMLLTAMFALCPAGQQAWAMTDSWFGTMHRQDKGSGTKEDPYLITNAKELAFLIGNYDYNYGVCNHKYYKLTTDIDLHWTVWRFGTADYDSRSFRGHFDGAGHKISNLDIRLTSTPYERHFGLFGQMGGDEAFESVIENLEIDSVRYTYEKSDKGSAPSFQFVLGGIVGQMYANSRIENCIVRNMETVYDGPERTVTSDQYLRIAPLVGNVQQRFGLTEKAADVPSARIIHSYGTYKGQFGQMKGDFSACTFEHQQGEPYTGEYNGYTWHKMADGSCSFSKCDVRIADLFTSDNERHNTTFGARVSGEVKGQALTYRWTIGGESVGTNSDRVEIGPSTCPRSLCCEVYDAEGHLLGSGAHYVRPATAELLITAKATGGNSYNLVGTIEAYQANDLARDFIWSWLDITEGGKEVGTSRQLTGARQGHTYQLIGYHRKYKFYKLSNWASLASPIYVCRNGIDEAHSSQYTTDGKTYNPGNDANNGLTPETAVRSLRRAYELLHSREDGLKPGDNIIVIMGDYNEPVFNTYIDGKKQTANAAYFKKDKPAIILGKYGTLRGGRLLFNSEYLQIDEETTFENLVLHGAPDTEGTNDADMAVVYANDHDLTFGYGLQMEGYRTMDKARGLAEGVRAPHFTVFGGFYDLDEPDYQYREHNVTIRSGYMGRVLAGNRFSGAMPRSGQISGSPRFPVRTHIILDVANTINNPNYAFDVAMVVGGQGDGSSFSVSTIDINGTSTVGRVIGGNIGYGRTGRIAKRNNMRCPSDSYFGQSTININGGIVNEVYGASLGRASAISDPVKEAVDSCVTYFYGKAIINITGGMVRNTIYGASSGGVTGLAASDGQHTFDPYIPYNLSNGQLVYGDYKQAKGKLPRVFVSGDSLIDLNRTQVIINVSGTAYLRGTIYGGGYGFSNMLRTRHATSQVGNHFGDTYINITGGHVDGYIYGGGRPSLAYYDNHDCSGYPVREGKEMTKQFFTTIAQVHGNTHINISGGDIYGMVFGGGEGSYYRPVSETDDSNFAAFIGAVFGSTHVDISGQANIHNFVFGAGNYADVLAGLPGTNSDPEAGNVYLTISGGKIENSVFGAGHGHHDLADEAHSVISDIQGDVHLTITGGEFVWVGDTLASRYDSRRYYGIYGSGRDASIVHGDTYVEVHRSLFSPAFIKAAGLERWDHQRASNGTYALCGGGYGWRTDVMGSTHVDLNIDQAPDFDPALFEQDHQGNAPETISYLNFNDIFGGGLRGVVHGSTNVTVRGRGYFRNIYGGGMAANVGEADMPLNGNLYEHDYGERHYTTGTHVNILSGACYNVFGGGLMGHVGGETEINIGSPTDTIGNAQLYIHQVYGGNDVTGTIAGSNNPNYGTRVNIFGGRITGDIYASGNGQFDGYDIPSKTSSEIHSLAVGRERPHVASASVSIGGVNERNRAIVEGKLYMGGNATTVGLFARDTLEHPEWGMLREHLLPNSGRIRLNIASHCRIDTLVMGCNGRNLMRNIPHYTLDGSKWYKGFFSEQDFLYFCRNIDISCVPQLTFNSNRSFSNQYAINDLYGNIREFNTHDEMDAEDVEMIAFFGGGYRGSMTSDSVYNYTLPPGLLIHGLIVGGSRNPTIHYREGKGPNQGTERTFVGGMRPYEVDNNHYHRIQLNIFCRFSDLKLDIDDNGAESHIAAKIFGGCYDRGIVLGAASVNLHTSLFGRINPDINYFKCAEHWNTEGGHIYGAGKGSETEVIGNTYVALKGCKFNDKPLMPAALNVFGGSMQGNVIGRGNVQIDLEAPGCTPEMAAQYCIYGKVYGGGRMGSMKVNSIAMPEMNAGNRGATTHVTVNSGHIQDVYGGGRLGDIEGGCWVDIDDKASHHGHTIISNVYGGNDISGSTGSILILPWGMDKRTRINTYIYVNESMKADSTYTGFPFIGNLFGGGNGNYGDVASDGTYASGSIQSRTNQNIDLTGRTRPDVDSTYVHVAGGTVWNLYGGANAAKVNKYTLIRLDIRDTTARASFDRTVSPACYEFGANMYRNTRSKEGWEFDDTRMRARFNVHRMFGGNNQSPMTIQPVWRLRQGKIGTIYGGCNIGDVLYYNELGDTKSANADKNNIIEPGLTLPLESAGLYVDNVFGGSRMGTVRASKITYDKASGRRDTTAVTFADNQYGTNILILAGQYGRIFGGNDVSGTINNGTRITMEGGVVGEIYGAGNGDYFYQVSDDVPQVTETWDAEAGRWIYRVPRNKSPEYNVPTCPDICKLWSINDWRPNVNKCYVEIFGGRRRDGSRRTAYVTGAIYAGGLSSTVTGPNGTNGIIRLDIGDHCVINQLYMGSNGERYVERKYIDQLFAYNNITNLDETDEGLGLFDYYMMGVAMNGLPKDFQLHRSYEGTYIGSFFMGGNHASLRAHGRLEINFPINLNIFDKIVGGSYMADFTYKRGGAQSDIIHHGGIIWDNDTEGSKPEIVLDVASQFLDCVMVYEDEYRPNNYLRQRDPDDIDTSPRVYGGCLGSGFVDGNIITKISDDDF